jgi:hypothetical protein
MVRRIGRVLCLALALVTFSGCAMFEWDTWNPENYRDDRARDIDSRLSEDRSIVQNPF